MPPWNVYSEAASIAFSAAISLVNMCRIAVPSSLEHEVLVVLWNLAIVFKAIF